MSEHYQVQLDLRFIDGEAKPMIHSLCQSDIPAKVWHYMAVYTIALALSKAAEGREEAMKSLLTEAWNLDINPGLHPDLEKKGSE